MSVLFTDTMTVYNFHRDPETDEESWIRSVVKGVQWRHNKTDVTSSGGVQTESKVESITVDFQRGYGNKPYLEPQKFRKLPAEEAAGYWTLDVQTDQDKLVLGESEKEIGVTLSAIRILSYPSLFYHVGDLLFHRELLLLTVAICSVK